MVAIGADAVTNAVLAIGNARLFLEQNNMDIKVGQAGRWGVAAVWMACQWQQQPMAACYCLSVCAEAYLQHLCVLLYPACGQCMWPGSTSWWQWVQLCQGHISCVCSLSATYPTTRTLWVVIVCTGGARVCEDCEERIAYECTALQHCPRAHLSAQTWGHRSSRPRKQA
jgi:hypothetical protein